MILVREERICAKRTRYAAKLAMFSLSLELVFEVPCLNCSLQNSIETQELVRFVFFQNHFTHQKKAIKATVLQRFTRAETQKPKHFFF